jgi:hypothetical protein
VSLLAPSNTTGRGSGRGVRGASQYARTTSRRARDALAALRPSRAEVPWVQPTAQSELALVLHGKISTLRNPSAYTPPDGGDPTVVRLLHAAIVRHLLAPNRHASVSVFAHSWSPRLGPLVDRLFSPAWSKHEPEHITPNARSAASSFAAALTAKRAYERRRGKRFDLVATIRYDTLLLTPLVLEQLPYAQLWFAAQCCGWRAALGASEYRLPRLTRRAPPSHAMLIPQRSVPIAH